mgnify:CR=1 FL=1
MAKEPFLSPLPFLMRSDIERRGDMWELYDALLDSLPDGMAVDEVVCGKGWTMVRSGENVGLAMTIHETAYPRMFTKPWEGADLKEIAACVKSWNFEEAAVGLAAINAFHNAPAQAMKNGIALTADGSAPEKDAFLSNLEAFRGKKVCVVGHFPYLEQRVAPYARLSILERAPRPGDFPDSACEYILPEQDVVFITGCTLVNKTLPRLLALSRQAHVVLVGPSVPLSTVLFDFGAGELSGTVITNPALCSQLAAAAGGPSIFQAGQMVRFVK